MSENVEKLILEAASRGNILLPASVWRPEHLENMRFPEGKRQYPWNFYQQNSR
jgi:hypothetical protein